MPNNEQLKSGFRVAYEWHWEGRRMSLPLESKQIHGKQTLHYFNFLTEFRYYHLPNDLTLAIKEFTIRLKNAFVTAIIICALRRFHFLDYSTIAVIVQKSNLQIRFHADKVPPLSYNHIWVYCLIGKRFTIIYRQMVYFVIIDKDISCP